MTNFISQKKGFVIAYYPCAQDNGGFSFTESQKSEHKTSLKLYCAKAQKYTDLQNYRQSAKKNSDSVCEISVKLKPPLM